MAREQKDRKKLVLWGQATREQREEVSQKDGEHRSQRQEDWMDLPHEETSINVRPEKVWFIDQRNRSI